MTAWPGTATWPRTIAGGPTLLSADSFNRANSATSLGSTDGAGTKDPAVWACPAGCTMGIAANVATGETYDATTGNAVGTVALGASDVDIHVTVPLINTSGLCFRFTDRLNYWYLCSVAGGGGNTILARLVAGAIQTVGTLAGAALNDVLRVVASGANVTAYRAGTQIFTTSSAFNQTAQSHGLFDGSFISGAATFDNWSASSLTGGSSPYPWPPGSAWPT